MVRVVVAAFQPRQRGARCHSTVNKICHCVTLHILSLYTKLLEEDLAPHLRILENLVPTDHLDIQVDILHPLEPAQTIRHGLEVLFPLKPNFNFGRQVADHVSIERGVIRNGNSGDIISIVDIDLPENFVIPRLPTSLIVQWFYGPVKHSLQVCQVGSVDFRRQPDQWPRESLFCPPL